MSIYWCSFASWKCAKSTSEQKAEESIAETTKLRKQRYDEIVRDEKCKQWII